MQLCKHNLSSSSQTISQGTKSLSTPDGFREQLLNPPLSVLRDCLWALSSISNIYLHTLSFSALQYPRAQKVRRRDNIGAGRHFRVFVIHYYTPQQDETSQEGGRQKVWNGARTRLIAGARTETLEQKKRKEFSGKRKMQAWGKSESDWVSTGGATDKAQRHSFGDLQVFWFYGSAKQLL